MKPLNNSTPMTEAVQKYLEKISKEKAIPNPLWESLKKAADKVQQETQDGDVASAG